MLLVSSYKRVLTGFLFFISLFIISISCDSTEPPPPDETKPTFTLAIDDASCTEVCLQLTTKDLTLPAELTLKQYNPAGDSVTQTFSLSTKDSLLYIDALLPNQIYNFQLSCIWNPTSGNQQQVSSIKQQVTTMDTTSHNFTWQTFTFGEHSSSVLYDVAIINENNIWAVGEIYMNDSVGNPDPTIYNAVHWDGNEWELKRIPFTYNGQTFYSGIRAIFAFNENDIWFGVASLMHWNGTIYQSISTASFFPATVNKMWGTSSNDFYIVGTNGQIAHYNGTNWQRIESGTNANIVDISGIQNAEGKYTKYCAADNVLLKIDGENAVSTINVEQGMFLNSVWAASNRIIYTAGSGVVLFKNNGWQTINSPEINTIYRIKGQSINDIVGLSANLSIFHFNGYSWNSIQTDLNNIYLKILIKNNTIATVGWQNDKAIITLLFRN
jgi:hypothetical protein